MKVLQWLRAKVFQKTVSERLRLRLGDRINCISVMFRSATKIHDEASYLVLVRFVVIKSWPQGVAKLLHANFTGLANCQNVNRKSCAL